VTETVPPVEKVAGPLLGDSGCVTTDGSHKKSLAGYAQASKGQGRCRTFTVYAPDGTDPPGTGNLLANTVTLFVGPNDSAGFPIAPGAWKDFEDVDPGEMAIDDGGTTGQHLFFAYGGSPQTFSGQATGDKRPAPSGGPALTG